MAQRIQFRESELTLLDDLLNHLRASGTEHDLLHGKDEETQINVSETRESAAEKVRRALRKEGYRFPNHPEE
jgi:hypothetical protein